MQPVRDIARDYGLEVILRKHNNEQEDGQVHALGLLYIEMNGAMVKRGDCKAVLVQPQQNIPESLQGPENEISQ